MSKPSGKKLALHWQILIAILLAVGAGLAAGERHPDRQGAGVGR